ncbi:GntR family transcriptional regulator [Candidatus Pelagibacter sp. HIMB1521]|uniref:GntR family transcriptional regulator n=1 Tax=Candidatus Pelagibacter sp. HIMB1521 TaxID=3413344 RepID=UPI003F848FFF
MSKTLAEKTYSIIEEKIVKLEYQPGSFITENFLEKNLKCGRTPIREAIQKLAGEGLIKVLPRKGLLITEININEQLSLVQVRREIERLMAKLAAKNSTINEKKQFKEISTAMKKCRQNDTVKFIKLDRQMNDLLSLSCGNEFVRRSIKLVASLSRRFWFYRNKGEIEDLIVMAKLHSAVCDAISQGNEKLAQSKSDKLMDYIENFTKDSINNI